MDTITDHYETCQAGPKYRSLAEAIRKSIKDGTLEAGSKLPPVRDLAWQLKITPGTVARAYTVLTDEGSLIAEVGRGTFVAEERTASERLARLDQREVSWNRHHVAEETDLVSLFSPKVPDVGQVAMIQDAFSRLSNIENPQAYLNYPSRAAYRPVRESVLRWLEGTHLGPVSEEDLILIHGGQSGVMVVLQTVLRGRKPTVLVEELCYPGFRRAAQIMRADTLSVPMDKYGIIPDALDRICRQNEAQVLCTCPEVHNPTGIVTPIERREVIAKVAAKHNLYILEDDCYRMSGMAQGPSYRALAPELGWHVSSISKTVSPALRVGFLVAPRGRAQAMRRTAEHSFFGLARPLADVTQDLLSRPDLYQMVAEVRSIFAQYVRIAVNELGRFELTWHEDVPFLWLKLPEGWRGSAFAQAAESKGVHIRTAEEFAGRDDHAPHAVRISVNGQISLDSFSAAMQRLRHLLENPPEDMVV